jgi:hypothetical protein
MERSDLVAYGQTAERAQPERAAAVDERYARRNVATGGHLAGEALDHGVGHGEKDNRARPRPQGPDESRHAVSGRG